MGINGNGRPSIFSVLSWPVDRKHWSSFYLKPPSQIFDKIQGGRRGSKLYSESGAKKTWVWWNHCGKLRKKKWTLTTIFLVISHESDTLSRPETEMMSKSRHSSSQSSSDYILYFKNTFLEMKPNMWCLRKSSHQFTAMRTICFTHSIFLLKACIVVKHSWNHFKQQLGIQTWFRIQSHVGLPMQITQMGWKSDERRVSTPG